MTNNANYEIFHKDPKILLTGDTGQLGLELRQLLRFLR